MKKKLLIVDDSLFVFEEMKLMLADSEFEIVEYAKSAEDALEKFESAMPDVVTMDIILPGMDGMDAAEILLQREPKTNIVIVSSLAYDETMERARKIGAKGFLFKPFDGKQLLESLTAVFQEA
ncbi:MAG: response regulator [Hungatella sp.]